MARHAFILGGTGQIGRAMAKEFLDAGWQVTISHRGNKPPPADLVEQGVRVAIVERDDPVQLAQAIGTGADTLIDTTAYDDKHADQLLALQDSIGSFVVISSASVYRDELGRTLDEAADNGFPDMPSTMTEAQPTVDPGPETYSTRKIALERQLLDNSKAPVTILRPCAIHGLNSLHPREWWVVKRILDNRPAIPLIYEGLSRFHTSAVANIAALARVAVETKKSKILNIGDPDTPSVAEIAGLIAKHFDYQGRIVKIASNKYPAPMIGSTPWSVPQPFMVNCQAALSLGYSPVTTYAEAIGPLCDGLVANANDGNWKDRFPVLASYPEDVFDYVGEDQFFAEKNYDLKGKKIAGLAYQAGPT